MTFVSAKSSLVVTASVQIVKFSGAWLKNAEKLLVRPVPFEVATATHTPIGLSDCNQDLWGS